MNCPHCNGVFAIAGGLAIFLEDEKIINDFISLTKDKQKLVMELVERLKNG